MLQNSWAKIALYLPGRSENSVKNKFQSLKKRAVIDGLRSHKTQKLTQDFAELDCPADQNINGWIDLLIKTKIEETRQTKTMFSTIGEELMVSQKNASYFSEPLKTCCKDDDIFPDETLFQAKFQEDEKMQIVECEAGEGNNCQNQPMMFCSEESDTGNKGFHEYLANSLNIPFNLS